MSTITTGFNDNYKETDNWHLLAKKIKKQQNRSKEPKIFENTNKTCLSLETLETNIVLYSTLLVQLDNIYYILVQVQLDTIC